MTNPQDNEKPDGYVAWQHEHKEALFESFTGTKEDCIWFLKTEFPLMFEEGQFKIRPVKLVFLDEEPRSNKPLSEEQVAAFLDVIKIQEPGK